MSPLWYYCFDSSFEGSVCFDTCGSIDFVLCVRSELSERRCLKGNQMLRRKNRVGAAVFAVLAIFGSAAIAGDVVVLDSTVSSVPAGEVFDEAHVVSVPSGGQLTLIAPDGDTRILNGPYEGAIGASQVSDGVSLTALTASRGGDTKVLGAVRAPKWEIND
jgi:hypothetical protein